MSFTGYLGLWADRQVRALFLAAFFARIPNLAIPLVLTLLVVVRLDGTYAQAGIVVAAETVGAAVGAPWRGRLIDRLGLRRAMIPSIVGCMLIYPTAAFASYTWLVPLAFLAGLFVIPVFSVVRLALTALVEEDRRRIAFAGDAVVAEASFLIGPAAGALIATHADPGMAIVLIGACEVLAGLAFFQLNPPMGCVRGDASPMVVSPLRWITAPVMFTFIVSAGTVVALMGTDLAIIAELRELHSVDAVWLVFFFWGISSLLGGLVYGALPSSIRPMHLLLALGLLTIPIGLGSTVWSLGLWVIPAGFLCTPTMIAATEAITRLVPEDRRGEAMGWQGTAFTVGGALSAPFIGRTIDGVGAWGGFAVGGGVAVAVALLSYGSRVVARPAHTQPRVAQIRHP